MDFTNMFLLTSSILIAAYTTEAVHPHVVDLEEMFENRQEQAAMTTTTETMMTTENNPVAEPNESGGNAKVAGEPLPTQNKQSNKNISDLSTGLQQNISSTSIDSRLHSANRSEVSGQQLPKPGAEPSQNKSRLVLWSTSVCKYIGPCSGKSGKQCPNGSTCEYIQGNKEGWCCQAGSNIKMCLYGQDGECGTRHGLVCRPQTTCMFRSNFPDAGGKCCIDQPSKEQCLYGQDGECGTTRRLVCRTGTTCMFDGNFTDAGGRCCIDTPGEKFCPSGVTGTSCTRSDECKPRYTCRFGNCCLDPVCPAGWLERGPCNTLEGQPRCEKGYECINGLCCSVPDKFCPSGVVGRVCTGQKPCKAGYSCRFGYCCRNKACPKSWKKGGLCNMSPGQPKCRDGFTCINEICCQSRTRLNANIPKTTAAIYKQHTTPGIVTKQTNTRFASNSNEQRKLRIGLRDRCNGTPIGKCGGPRNIRCPTYSECAFMNNETSFGVCCRTRPVCSNGFMGPCGGSVGRHCPYGSTCKYLQNKTEGWCCKEISNTVTCPFGADGVCGTILRLKCRKGTTCRLARRGVSGAGGKCCINNPKEEFCPSGEVGQACSSRDPCQAGYTCRYGFCCRDVNCPNNWTEGGSCNSSSGGRACQVGYSCIDSHCCQVPENVCPSGVLGPTCSGTKPCKIGYTCRSGYCCRKPKCPDERLATSTCSTVLGNPNCETGYKCINNYCCPTQTTTTKIL